MHATAFQKSFESRAERRHYLTAYCWMEVARLRTCFSGLGLKELSASFATAVDGRRRQRTAKHQPWMRAEESMCRPPIDSQLYFQPGQIWAIQRIKRAGISFGRTFLDWTHSPELRLLWDFDGGSANALRFLMGTLYSVLCHALISSTPCERVHPSPGPRACDRSTSSYLSEMVGAKFAFACAEQLAASSQRGGSLLVGDL